MDILDHLESDN